MMKVTITIEDEGKSRVKVVTEFDPPIKGNSKTTPASTLAVRLIESIPALSKKKD